MLAGAWLLATFLLSTVAFAQLAVPPYTAHVVDQTGTLSAAQQQALEQTLVAFEARKGSQLAVLMVPTTAPDTVEQYALRVAEQWKLGRKKVDDGALLLVAKNDRTLRIEVGYGLEGALTDLISQRIINETIVPRFKQQDYAGGIEAGLALMVRVIDGEPLPAPPTQAQAQDALGQVWGYAPVLFGVALVVGGILRKVFGKTLGSLTTGALVAGVAWAVAGTLAVAALAGLLAMLFTLVGGAMLRIGLGGLGGGWGGRGGPGGGGPRGGGGGFGGGGASGRW